MKKILFLLSFALLLCYPSASLFYAATGLQLWFECMVPVLFPFMILSGIVIRQNLTDSITGALSPFLSPLFHITPGGIYCLIIGFLCGFPMGARTVAQMYERGSLSRREAAHLLSFCNNIGLFSQFPASDHRLQGPPPSLFPVWYVWDSTFIWDLRRSYRFRTARFAKAGRRSKKFFGR